MVERAAPKPLSRREGIARFFGVALLSVAIAGGGCQVVWISLTRIPAPQIEIPDPGLPTQTDDDRTEVGKSFLEHRRGIWVMGHQGSAAEIGAAHAILGQNLNMLAEDELFAELARWIPLPPLQILMSKITQWQYRRVLPRLPDWFTHELWAYAEHYEDPYAYAVPTYQRLLYYHLLHDITQEIPGDSPLLACTAWATGAPLTADGHLLLGRNFDFEVFDIFDREKVVHIYARDGAIPFASVAWMGLAGVVTGLNAEGLWISVNAARSEGRNRQGLPVIVLTRQILEQAHTIKEAQQIIAQHPTLVSDTYLLGDGKSGEAMIVERGVVTEKFGIIPMDERGWIATANHMRTSPFEDDKRDQTIREGTSSLARQARAEQYLSRLESGAVGVEDLVRLARDRTNLEGEQYPPGHRNAIDAMIATHSVVADASTRTIWVSVAPHTLGGYVRIDLLDELDAMGIDTQQWRASAAETRDSPVDIAPDTFLTNGWERLLDARRQTKLGWRTRRANARQAEEIALAIIDNHEAHIEAWFLLARSLEDQKRSAEAKQAFERYLAFDPPRGTDLEYARRAVGLPPIATTATTDLPIESGRKD